MNFDDGNENFFTKDLVTDDLMAKLAAPKITLSDPSYTCQHYAMPVNVLKEWRTEYQGSLGSVNWLCDSSGSACEVTRCLTVTGTMLITADVNVEKKLKVQSLNTVTKLQVSDATEESIRLALNCT